MADVSRLDGSAVRGVERGGQETPPRPSLSLPLSLWQQKGYPGTLDPHMQLGKDNDTPLTH